MFPNICPSPAFAWLQFKHCLLIFRAGRKKQSDEERFCIIQRNSSLNTYLLTASQIMLCNMQDGRPAKCSDVLHMLLSLISTIASQEKSYHPYLRDTKTEAQEG